MMPIIRARIATGRRANNGSAATFNLIKTARVFVLLRPRPPQYKREETLRKRDSVSNHFSSFREYSRRCSPTERLPRGSLRIEASPGPVKRLGVTKQSEPDGRKRLKHLSRKSEASSG